VAVRARTRLWHERRIAVGTVDNSFAQWAGGKNGHRWTGSERNRSNGALYRNSPGMWRYRRQVDQKTQQPASEGRSEDRTARPDPAECARCGATSGNMPITWTCSVEGGERLYFCDHCGRTHLRSIEGRLGSAWW
jgi:hypothetical protein